MKQSTTRKETMNSCLANMWLASYYSGQEQVRLVARQSALRVEYQHRVLLMRISLAKDPCSIVDATIDNLIGGDVGFGGTGK